MHFCEGLEVRVTADRQVRREPQPGQNVGRKTVRRASERAAWSQSSRDEGWAAQIFEGSGCAEGRL